MKFTVIGHSCLFVETRAGSILVDPWLFGSAYWRSWWHYPPSADPRPEWLTPDYMYFTHHHFDHLHYPSARAIDKGARVWLPRFGVDTMAHEIRGLGFTDVEELDHGLVVDVGGGVRVASFQYGFDDTTFVIADGTHVLVNVNDCKIRGRSLARVVEAFGRPTFVFKSYSFAQSYPIAYTADDPADLEILHRRGYIDDFMGRMREFQPQFAVPFGSMVAFLHPECRDLNEHLVSPHEVEAAANEEPTGSSTVVVMAPGDSWDSHGGFAIAERDWYSDRDGELKVLASSVATKFDEQAALEAGVTLEWETFRAYFTGFVRALPWPMGGMACKRPIVFWVASSPLHYWIVDVRARRVYRAAAPPANAADLIRIPEAVLADAIEKRIVHYIHISMRGRVELRAGGATSDLAFWAILGVWELGYLQPSTFLTRRFWSVAWRRRDEAIGMVSALRGRGTISERLAAQFAEGDRAQSSAVGVPE